MIRIEREARKCLKDIEPPKPPPGVPQARFQSSFERLYYSGAKLGWYRGRQFGIFEAYKVIAKIHPRVAKKILTHFGMDEKGDQ